MLTERDHEVIRQCLRAAADGPFFPDWEFHTLFGFDRLHFRTLAASYVAGTDASVHVGVAVHNSLGNLLGYPIDNPSELSAWVDATEEEIRLAFEHWRSTHEYT